MVPVRFEKLLSLIAEAEVVEPLSAGPLQVFGLRWAVNGGLTYTTLDEALTAGSVEIAEVSEGGSVPTVVVVNKGATMLFLMAGEQLIGAKQNRVLNASLMVGPRATLPAPVSCVEAGRWGYRSRRFGGGGSSHSKLRAMMSKQVSEGYRRYGGPAADQSGIWCEIDRKLRAMKSPSPSSALHQAYEDHRARLDAILRDVRVPADCHGVAFSFGGRIAGVDLFDQPTTLAKLLPKLASAYAIDALEEPDGAKPVERTAVADWLRAAATARFERFNSPGLGTDCRIESAALVGATLLVEDRPIHLELFPESAK